ncbi:MAG: DEAD/DEAH box helicase family protein [Patescibacteria group bacterium]
MNNISFKKYQQETVDNIYEQADKFLKSFDGVNFKKILFRSPTGSGKTVMMSGIIERLALESESNLSFVWISKGVLAEQSKDSLEENIGGGGIVMSFLEDILDNEIKENEVLFINWEQIFSKAGKDNPDKDIKKGDPINKFMKDNEYDKNLRKFCENTQDEGRKVVLIVDESHLNITPNTIQIIEEIIKPALQIDMTATPKIGGGYVYGDREGEYVELQTVKDAQMIKKEVIINPEIKSKDLKSEKSGDQIIFEEALKKREELEKLYKKEGSKIRPLVLVQLPNEGEKLSALDKQKRDWVEKFLDERGFSYKNKNLARWLTGDDKENLEDIKKLNSRVDFLIFKQVVATGWDCPRAHILVKFRQTKSEIFEIQTVGRIMRMPEFKHYKEEDLNRAYVYANLEEIKIEEDALEYLKVKKAIRIKSYKDIDLKSVYLMRGEYNDLMLDYRKYFFDEFIDKIGGKLNEKEARNNLNLLKKFKSADGTSLLLDIKRIEEKMIVDGLIKDIDKENQNIKAEEKNKVKMDDEEVERKFIAFLKKNCGEFQQARSFDKIRVAIYQIFEKYLGIKSIDKLYVQKVILTNMGFSQSIIQDSIKKYAKYRGKVEKKYKEIPKWNVPKEDYYSKNTVVKNYKRCVMVPTYVSPKWKTEMGFIENYLEKNKNIAWWFKNGDAKNEIYLGIPYNDEKEKPATFYADFIVHYKDGRTGIFDTKGGQTATSSDTKLKAEALQVYIKENKADRLFGGISKSDNENRIWTLNQDKKYDYENGKWKSL